jgi:hypothetical protein
MNVPDGNTRSAAWRRLVAPLEITGTCWNDVDQWKSR